MSNVSKGRYHSNRTKEFFVGQGYDVEPLEVKTRVYRGEGEFFFKTRDIWGCDLMAKSEDEILFIQVKANGGHVSKGVRELERTQWPPGVRVVVVHWPPRRRMVEGPDIHEVQVERGGATLFKSGPGGDS